ncbi:MAG TPA: hypothetical protein VHG89_01855 [Verrucomicrobiae bacterium]|nr:hypothetical protein [Verrucomicrobiae bacterium]
MFPARFLRVVHCLILLAAFCCRANAEFSLPDKVLASSASGQFIVTGDRRSSPLANAPTVVTNSNFVRLEPALLAVSAERIKKSLGQKLDIGGQWRGKISLVLHPAQSLNEEVTIVCVPMVNGWNYQVQLPDVLSRTRFTRALVSVVLMEFANRNAQGRAAEVPAWLVDGLSQQLLAENLSEIILSQPDKILNGLVTNKTGIDPLAGARNVLQNASALTFDQLNWPTATQLSGADNGVYYASAQLFVSALLNLKNGSANLRTMLVNLPRFYNWQSAFLKAFRENFPRPLDVEKWWALQIVGFVAHDPGPRWTLAVSRDKLEEILSVPVEMRATSNALPTHAEISLQTVIRNFNSDEQRNIFQIKLRDLSLAQLRMAPQLAALTDSYRRSLAAYLGEHGGLAASTTRTGRTPVVRKAGASETLKKLDKLDAQRRAIEVAIKPDIWRP